MLEVEIIELFHMVEDGGRVGGNDGGSDGGNTFFDGGTATRSSQYLILDGEPCGVFSILPLSSMRFMTSTKSRFLIPCFSASRANTAGA